MNTSAMMKLAITLGALFVAHKYGEGWVKVAATGAAGFVLLNQVPVVRDGLSVRVLPDSTATAA